MSAVNEVDPMADDEPEWFGVRCVFVWSGWEGRPFEERITLWRAQSLDQAIELAEREAEEYAEANGSEYLHFSQAYAITEGSEIGSGTEVFSLLRDSDLAPDEYLSTFFSTGGEHTQEPTEQWKPLAGQAAVGQAEGEADEARDDADDDDDPFLPGGRHHLGIEANEQGYQAGDRGRDRQAMAAARV
jgi:hypothetical protein